MDKRRGARIITPAFIGPYRKPIMTRPQPAESLLKLKTKKKYKSQDKLKRLLEQILKQKAKEEQTFEWLLSPRGAKLRVDIYFPELKLAVEYHGKQHSYFPNVFHKTAEDFRYANMCDAWKKSQLKFHGIKLIEFSYNDKLILDVVKQRLISEWRFSPTLARGNKSEMTS